MLQNGFSFLRTKASKFNLALNIGQTEYKINSRSIFTLICILLFAYSAHETFTINKGMSFSPPSPFEPRATQIINLIKSRDPGTYYVQFGERGDPYWNFIFVAISNEIPVINARYTTLLNSVAAQTPSDPIVADPRYIVVAMDKSPSNGVLLKEYDGIGVWEVPDALPMAFTTNQNNINDKTKLTNKNTIPLTFRYDGPNRIVVTGTPQSAGDPLVILISDYPGWKVYRDNQRLPITAVNGFMTVPMDASNHTYTFVYDPDLYKIGLAISLLTILILIYLIISEFVAHSKKSSTLTI
jgi:hypothetical protein